MLKNVSSNWVLTLVQIAVTFVLMPFTIRMLGQDQYGTWILIASITSYLSMLALGVPMATVRFVARYSSGGEQEELDRAVGSCAGLYAMIGAAAMVCGIILYVVFRSIYDLPAGLDGPASIAFGIVVIYIAAGFFGQLPYGIMSAHHDFVLKNKIQIAGLVLRLGLTYVLLTYRATFIWLAVIQLSTLTAEFAIAMIMVRRRYPHIHVRFRDFDWGMVRRIFSFSLFVLVLQVGGQLTFQTDSLVIGAFLPVSQIPYFTVASSLSVYVMEFVIAIAAVVMPMATSLEAKGEWDQLRVVFLKWSKITLSLTLMVSVYLVVLGPRFIGWWIGDEFVGPAGAVLRILMLANLVFLPVRGVALPVLMGLGKPGRPTIAFLIASVVNLGLSIALVRPMGLNGVALGTAVPNVVYASFVLLLACRVLNIRITEWVGYVLGRTVIGVIPVAAFAWWLRFTLDVHGFLELFLAGIATVLVFGVVWVVVVYRRDRYVALPGFLARLAGGSPPS